MARPRTFDRDRVLDAATVQFWRHGLHATTADDLCRVTRLGRSSLYNAFESKDALFSACLDRYLRTTLVAAREAMADPERNSVERIEALLLAVVAQETERQAADDPRGCLAVNSVAELVGDPSHSADLELVRTDTASRLGVFADVLRAGQAAGEVTADVDADELAAFVNATVAGLRISSQEGASAERLRGIVRGAIRAIKA